MAHTSGRRDPLNGATWRMVPDWLWEHDAVTGTDIKVFCAVQKHANREGECWPSHARLATLANTSRSQVQRSLERLEAVGALLKKERPGTSHVYVLSPLAAPPRGKGCTNVVQEGAPPWCTNDNHLTKPIQRDNVSKRSYLGGGERSSDNTSKRTARCDPGCDCWTDNERWNDHHGSTGHRAPF